MIYINDIYHDIFVGKDHDIYDIYISDIYDVYIDDMYVPSLTMSHRQTSGHSAPNVSK